MKPYYEHAGITIYHGDCREVMEEWEGLRMKSFDLLLTDPPYGIGASNPARGGKRNGHALTESRDYGDLTWDSKPADVETLLTAARFCTWQVIFGGNYFPLPPRRGWLVWDKDNGDNNYADCELAWTNFEAPIRRFRYRWMGMFTEPSGPKEERFHPTQKPEPVMRWCLMQAGEAKSVFDPFMGSGTTLVTAKRLSRQAVGIELHEKYCEIAAKRLSQDVLPLMEPDPEHTTPLDLFGL